MAENPTDKEYGELVKHVERVIRIKRKIEFLENRLKELKKELKRITFVEGPEGYYNLQEKVGKIASIENSIADYQKDLQKHKEIILKLLPIEDIYVGVQILIDGHPDIIYVRKIYDGEYGYRVEFRSNIPITSQEVCRE